MRTKKKRLDPGVMTMPVTRDAYERLVADDIRWLMRQPRTLERDHILRILQASPDHEYPPNARCVGADREARTITLEFPEFPEQVVIGDTWAARPATERPQHCDDCAPDFGCWGGAEPCRKIVAEARRPFERDDDRECLGIVSSMREAVVLRRAAEICRLIDRGLSKEAALEKVRRDSFMSAEDWQHVVRAVE